MASTLQWVVFCWLDSRLSHNYKEWCNDLYEKFGMILTRSEYSMDLDQNLHIFAECSTAVLLLALMRHRIEMYNLLSKSLITCIVVLNRLL